MTDSHEIDVGSMRVWFEHLAKLTTTPPADRAKLGELVKLCEAYEAQRQALHAWMRGGGGKLVEAPAFKAMGLAYRQIREALTTLPEVYAIPVTAGLTRH